MKGAIDYSAFVLSWSRKDNRDREETYTEEYWTFKSAWLIEYITILNTQIGLIARDFKLTSENSIRTTQLTGAKVCDQFSRGKYPQIHVVIIIITEITKIVRILWGNLRHLIVSRTSNLIESKSKN